MRPNEEMRVHETTVYPKLTTLYNWAVRCELAVKRWLGMWWWC